MDSNSETHPLAPWRLLAKAPPPSRAAMFISACGGKIKLCTKKDNGKFDILIALTHTLVQYMGSPYESSTNTVAIAEFIHKTNLYSALTPYIVTAHSRDGCRTCATFERARRITTRADALPIMENLHNAATDAPMRLLTRVDKLAPASPVGVSFKIMHGGGTSCSTSIAPCSASIPAWTPYAGYLDMCNRIGATKNNANETPMYPIAFDPSWPVRRNGTLINPFTDIFPPCFDDIIAPILVHAVCGSLQTLMRFAEMALEKIRSDAMDENELLKLCRGVANIQLVSKKFFRLFRPVMHLIAASIEEKLTTGVCVMPSDYFKDLCFRGQILDLDRHVEFSYAFGDTLNQFRTNLKKVGSLYTARSLDAEFRNGPRGIEIYSTDINGVELTYRKNKSIVEFIAKKEGVAQFRAKRTYHDDSYSYFSLREGQAVTKTITIVDGNVEHQTYDHSAKLKHHLIEGKRATITKNGIFIAIASPATLYTYYPSGKKEIAVDEKRVLKYDEDGELLINCQKTALRFGSTITAEVSALDCVLTLHPCEYLKSGLWK